MPNITVKKFANILRAVEKSDNDNIVCISGARGIGKSTLMIHCIRELIGPYDFSINHVYSREELQEKMAKFPSGSCIGGDEAINSMYKRDWQNKKQIEIVKDLNMYRDKRHFVYLLIPHFWDFDSSVLNSLIIKYWVYIYGLGESLVFSHDPNPFSKDPWNISLNLKLWARRQIYRSPNYITNMGFSELPADVYKEYKRIKAQKRLALKFEVKEKPVVSKAEVIRRIKQINPNASISGMSKMLATDAGSIKKVLWVGGSREIIS